MRGNGADEIRRLDFGFAETGNELLL